MRSRIIIAAIVGLMLAGCFKTLSYKTMYVLKPLVQTESSGEIVTLANVKSYAFAVDTTDWYVASYEDALAGIITSKKSSSERITTPIGISGPFEPIDGAPASVNWIQMSVESPMIMVVAIDTEHKIYGYRNQQLEVNVPWLYVTVIFHPWKPAKKYENGAWLMVNEFYTPTPDPDPNPDPDPQQ